MAAILTDLADVRDRYVGQVVAGRSFADVGGLYEITKERITVARAHGATEVALIDICPAGASPWDEMRAHLAQKGIVDCRLISDDLHRIHGEQFDVIYSSGVLYHIASPLHYLEALRRLAREHVVLASSIVPDRVPGAADIAYPAGSVLYLPAVPPEQRAQVAAFFAQHGRPDIFAGAGKPLHDIFGVYWLPTSQALVAMCRDVGFEVLDHRPIEGDSMLGYALLLRVPHRPATRAERADSAPVESASPPIPSPALLPDAAIEASARMKADWNARASEDVRWFIATLAHDQPEADFDESGRSEVRRFVLAEPLLGTRRGRLLEIGCGIGRMTRHLASAFAEVHATDVSGEMIKQARERLTGLENVILHETNGLDFAGFPANYFDAALCAYVFQHVPSTDVIEANIRDGCRVLKPGGIFKFQTNAVIPAGRVGASEPDTWTGAPFAEAQIRQIAARTEMQLVGLWGSGTPNCWAAMRKPSAFAVCDGTSAQIVWHGAHGDLARQTIRPRGRAPCLTLIVRSLRETSLDINALGVSLDGRLFKACYAGPLRDDCAAFLLAHPPAGAGSLDELVQIDVALAGPAAPTDADEHGMANRIRQALRLQLDGSPLADPIEVEILPPAPPTPTVEWVSNAADGGADILLDGEKSRIRIFVRDLDLATTPLERVRIRIRNTTVAPAHAEWIATHAMHAIIAQLPAGLPAGRLDVVLIAGELASEPYTIKVDSGRQEAETYWLERVRVVLAATDEIDDRWIKGHAHRYATSLAELAGLDGERGAAFEIGLTRVFPFVLLNELGYRRVFATEFTRNRAAPRRLIKRWTILGTPLRVPVFNVDLERQPIPLPDASVDLVLCCEVLEHMDVDPMFMLAEINRITKPGGHLFLTTPNITSSRAVWKIMNGYAPHFFMQYLKDLDPNRHNYEHDVHSLQALTRAAGFETRMIRTADVFEACEPRGLGALDRLGMSTTMRGDDIFFVGRKKGPVVDRWPPELYV